MPKAKKVITIKFMKVESLRKARYKILPPYLYVTNLWREM